MADIFNMLDTWNASGTTFTGIKLNVVDTASAADSMLMDLQVGGASLLRMFKNGELRISSSTGFFTTGSSGTNSMIFGNPAISSAPAAIQTGTGITLKSDVGFAWANGAVNGTRDTILLRDAANTLAQRNGVNAQAFNLYDTYTDASNYRRTSMYWTGGAFFIDNDLNAGTGITNASFWIKSRGNIYLSQGGGGYDVVTNANGSGSFYPGGTTNTTNLGRSDKTFALGYFGTAAIIGGYVQVTEMTAPAAPATNNVRIYAEDDGAGKTRLMARFATGAAQQIAIEP